MPAVSAPGPLNNTARVLLGMVAEGHGTGYAIKAEIERSTRVYWGASVGGIYPELRRLTEAGLLRVRDDPRGGARRHCYSLTAAGRRALHEWLTDGAEPALEMRNEALLKLRFAGVLSGDEQLAIIDQMRAAHVERATELQQRLDAGDFDDLTHRLTIEFGVGWNEWAAQWCEGAARALSGQAMNSAARAG